MNETTKEKTLTEKKHELQKLLLRIPTSGSYESVSLTQKVSELTTEIELEERLEREKQSGGSKKT